MLRPIVSLDEVREAQRKLKAAFASRADYEGVATIKHQGGNTERQVFWHTQLEMWGSINDNPPHAMGNSLNRCWNAFGFDDPRRRNGLSIVCEVNPPHEGISRSIQGLFALDKRGALLLLHRGTKINGVTKEFFRREFQGNWAQIPDGRHGTPVAVVANIDSERVARDIGTFAREVARLKMAAKAR